MIFKKVGKCATLSMQLTIDVYVAIYFILKIGVLSYEKFNAGK